MKEYVVKGAEERGSASPRGGGGSGGRDTGPVGRLYELLHGRRRRRRRAAKAVLAVLRVAWQRDLGSRVAPTYVLPLGVDFLLVA